MKKYILKIVSFLLKNTRIVVLITLLCISVSYNIKLKTELDKFLVYKDIKGTYIMQSDNPHDPEYFVFLKEGKFYRYKQFQLLDTGSYKKIYDNGYILKSDNIDEYIIYSNEQFHFYDRKQNNILIYSKISNTPTFINIRY